MSFASGFEHRDAGSVLVAYANFGVGAGAALRLMDSAVVVLARASWALAALAGDAPCDVLVLCPYLDGKERDALLAVATSRAQRPAVLELADVVDGSYTVRPLGDAEAPGAGGPFVRSVLSALAAPTS
jgi:hypothetical protein